jgi:hypothetical protein
VHANVHASRIGAAIIDVENVEEHRCFGSQATPPGSPCQELLTSKRDPHPFPPSASVSKVGVSVENKLSATALSQQLPGRLRLDRTPLLASTLVYA